MLLVTWFIRNHLPSSPEATTSVPTPMAVNSATTPNKISETVKTSRRDPAADLPRLRACSA